MNTPASRDTSLQCHVCPAWARPIAAAALALLLLAGCGGGAKYDEPAARSTDSAAVASPYFSGDRILVDSIRVDFLGNGDSTLVIATRLLSDSTTPADRFDRVDIFTDSSGRRPVFTDVLEYGARHEVRDVTGDSIPEFIVEVDAGGNTPITSLGMHVYGRTAKGKITLLFYSTNGAPVLRDLDKDGREEILVSDQYWGMMPHSEAVGFTRDVYSFDGSRYVQANKRFASWFDMQLAASRKTNTALRQKVSRGEDMKEQLYTATVELLLLSWARGGAAEVRRLWKKEQREIRSLLSDEYYDDLQTFVSDVEIMSRQQERNP